MTSYEELLEKFNKCESLTSDEFVVADILLKESLKDYQHKKQRLDVIQKCIFIHKNIDPQFLQSEHNHCINDLLIVIMNNITHESYTKELTMLHVLFLDSDSTNEYLTFTNKAKYKQKMLVEPLETLQKMLEEMTKEVKASRSKLNSITMICTPLRRKNTTNSKSNETISSIKKKIIERLDCKLSYVEIDLIVHSVNTLIDCSCLLVHIDAILNEYNLIKRLCDCYCHIICFEFSIVNNEPKYSMMISNDKKQLFRIEEHCTIVN